MTGKALNAESHDQSSPLGISRGLRMLSTGIPQARTAESYPGPPRSHLEKAQSPAVPTLPVVGSACCVPRGGHASLGSGVRADNTKANSVCPSRGEDGSRRLGEVQLTVRYVCLRRCLRVLVNGCR